MIVSSLHCITTVLLSSGNVIECFEVKCVELLPTLLVSCGNRYYSEICFTVQNFTENWPIIEALWCIYSVLLDTCFNTRLRLIKLPDPSFVFSVICLPFLDCFDILMSRLLARPSAEYASNGVLTPCQVFLGVRTFFIDIFRFGITQSMVFDCVTQVC